MNKSRTIMTRLFVPSAASIVVHVLLLIIILAATITVTRRENPRPTLTDVVIAAAPPPTALPATNVEPQPRESAPQIAAATLALPTEPLTSFAQVPNLANTPLPSVPSASRALLDASVDQPQRAVSFAGLSGKAAQRVVYVVDASGGMVSSFAFIRAKLAHSIAGLSPTQHFQILITRQQASSETVVRFQHPEPSRDDLVRALPAHRNAAISWLKSLIVGGKSDPLEGLKAALALEPAPDLVFFLSRGFVRANADSAWSVETVLAELDRLNPRSRRNGQRPVVIKTIQFLDDDPTGLMQAIADDHGDGLGSFRVLTIDDLADQGAQDDAIAAERDSRLDAVLRDVRAILVAVETDARHLACGLPRKIERDRVAEAVRDAERLLGPRIGDLVTPDSPLRARVASLRALIEDDSVMNDRAAALLDELFLVDADADAARRIALLIALARCGRIDDAQHIAASLESDIALLALPDHLAGELALACARFGLSLSPRPGAAWQSLLIEARAAHAWSLGQSDAFEPLLAFARQDPAHQRDIWTRVDAATTSVPSDRLSSEVLFARAMLRASSVPEDAVELLLMLAEREPGSGRSCDAFWEASVLLQSIDRALAADVLERFTQACTDDERTASALRAAVAWTSEGNDAVLARRLRAALDHLPTDPLADVWRARCAALISPPEAWPLLEAIAPRSPVAAVAMELAINLVHADESAATLNRALRLAERFESKHASPLRVRLVNALLAAHDPSVLDHARRLDLAPPANLLLLAQACLMTDRADEALDHLDNLTRLVPARSPEWWESWTLLLETLDERTAGAQADLIQAHLYRLTLIDPNLGGSSWKNRLDAIRTSTPGYTGKP